VKNHMLKTCSLCPFSRTKTLGLHPERAEDFAYSAQNPYADFVCHKTGETIEEGFEEGSIVRGARSKTCHGFLTLQREECGIEDDDDTEEEDRFEPDGDGFQSCHEMISRHEELWNKQRRRKSTRAANVEGA
jgi:hypothetical protein